MLKRFDCTDIGNPHCRHLYLPHIVFNYAAACVDYDPACSGYGVNGYCDGPAIGFSSDYLMKMCKKSCGFCKT